MLHILTTVFCCGKVKVQWILFISSHILGYLPYLVQNCLRLTLICHLSPWHFSNDSTRSDVRIFVISTVDRYRQGYFSCSHSRALPLFSPYFFSRVIEYCPMATSMVFVTHEAGRTQPMALFFFIKNIFYCVPMSICSITAVYLQRIRSAVLHVHWTDLQ